MLLETPAAQTLWQASSFTLADPDGESWTLARLQDNKPLLVAFICNHCPYVKAIAERFAADARQLKSEGINVVAINSNDYASYPADSPAMMKRFAAQHDFGFPYLVDEDQSVARAYDAVCTPDFFGFSVKGEMHYRGRLDDAGMGDSAGRTPELVQAMQLIARTGAGPATQHASMGCSIKWR